MKRALSLRRSRISAVAEMLEARQLLSVTLVSASPSGLPGTGGASYESDVSEDGQIIAFTSEAIDLAAEDVNVNADIFVRDLNTGLTTLVSASSDGAVSDGDSDQPSISSDGRFVVFRSSATNLDPRDSDPDPDIYLHDRSTGTTTLISVSTSNTGGGGASTPVISGNGQFVVFSSTAGNLTSDTDANAAADVFLCDLTAGTTTLVSVSTAGSATGNGASGTPAISNDGQLVAFVSSATNLATITDANDGLDVFVRNIMSGTTTAVSTNAASTATGNDASDAFVDMSGDGNFVAFSSPASDLVTNDTNGLADVFVRDLTAGGNQAGTTLVSAAAPGGTGAEQANGVSSRPSISRDGRFVAFQSNATNLTAGPDANDAIDVFFRDRQANTTLRLSDTVGGGAQGNQNSIDPSLSADATRVSFTSIATNLTENDTNNASDIFVASTAGDPPVGTAPTAAVPAEQPTLNAGATTYDFIVLYADETALDVASFGDNDIVVVPPAGGTPIPAALVSAAPEGDNKTASVVYRIAAPGGTFDASDNGLYSVQAQSQAVTDQAGNPVAAGQIGLLDINVSGGATPGPDLTPAIERTTPTFPAAVIGGARGTARVRISNTGDTLVSGPVGLSLRVSPTALLSDDGAEVITVRRKLRIQPGRSRVLNVRFLYPAVPDNAYFLLAHVNPENLLPESNTANNVSATASPITIAAPFVDLTPAVGTPQRGAFVSGRRTSVPVTISNLGNVQSRGQVAIDLFASTDNVLSDDDAPIATTAPRLSLRPGQSRTVRVKFAFPAAIPPSSYFVTARIDASNQLPESDLSNNTTVSTTPFIVSPT